MKKDIQEWLQQLCFRFHIEQPLYVLHDYKNDVDGKRYYRYRGSLTTPVVGKPKVCLGNFARTEEKARDMVATMLIRRLLSSTNHKLVDYITTTILFCWRDNWRGWQMKITNYNWKLQL
jgi:hypothetical protein